MKHLCKLFEAALGQIAETATRRGLDPPRPIVLAYGSPLAPSYHVSEWINRLSWCAETNGETL